MQVNLSLIPVMFGLVLCSATELTFNMVGFLAAVLTNCIDCVQNVFSKKLLNTGGLTPVELQFYTSLAAAALQIPLMLYSGIGTKLLGPAEGGVAEDEQLVTRRHWYLFIDAVLFHFQSVTAYFTMSLLGTVSQSVANTVKRSLLIFATILYFGNPITYLNVAGIVMVSIGDPPARVSPHAPKASASSQRGCVFRGICLQPHADQLPSAAHVQQGAEGSLPDGCQGARAEGSDSRDVTEGWRRGDGPRAGLRERGFITHQSTRPSIRV